MWNQIQLSRPPPPAPARGSAVGRQPVREHAAGRAGAARRCSRNLLRDGMQRRLSCFDAYHTSRPAKLVGALPCRIRRRIIPSLIKREPNAMQYKRISADSHLDLPWMPPDLFTSMAPARPQGTHALRHRHRRRAEVGGEERRFVRLQERRSARPAPSSSPASMAASTSWPRPASTPTAPRTSAGFQIRTCASRISIATASMPR